MANEKRLIDANECYERAHEQTDESYHIAFYRSEADVYHLKELLDDCPTVDAVEVEDPELLEAIKLLIKQYARSKASDYVHSPVAHALYHTWKQVDERRK